MKNPIKSLKFRLRKLFPVKEANTKESSSKPVKMKYKTRESARRDFWHRNTFADRGVVKQIFESEDYSLARLRRGPELFEKYRSIIESGNTPLIFDAGSNIGASAVWFASEFPGAHIVCFEPEDENFKLLEKNTYGLNVELQSAAVGCQDGFAALFDPGEGEWGYRAQVNDSGEIKLISLNNTLVAKKISGFVPFIAKIDIEGGEGELFASNTDWVDEFPLIIIELHDWLLPKEKTSQNFLRVISGLNRDFVHIGENIFSIKN